jgi:secreted trypsin-like serine protease
LKKRAEKHLLKTALSSICILALSSLSTCARNEASESQLFTIGGTDAKKTPSFVSLMMPAFENGKSPQCGGTIIDLEEGAIATAAHCVKNLNIKGLAIKVSPMSRAEFSKSNAIPVESLHIHPQFSENLNNDIALLFVNPEKLKAAGGKAAPMVRDGSAALRAGNIISMGYGNATSFGTAYSQKLLEVKVPVIPLRECRKAGEGDSTEFFAYLDERVLCAGTTQGGKDVCHGDSGGPAYLEKNGTRELVGLVS